MKPNNRKLRLYNATSHTTILSLPASPPSRQQQPIMITTTTSSISQDGGSVLSPPPSSSIDPIKTQPFRSGSSDSSIALTLLALFTAIFFMGFFSLYIRRYSSYNSMEHISGQRRRRRHRQNRGPTGHSPSTMLHNPYPPSSWGPRRGLDQAIIRSLPVYSYSGGTKYQVECLICLGEFREEEAVKTIPFCGHVFHLECVDMWLSSHVTCPVCRGTRLFAVGGNSGGVCSGVVNNKCEEGASACVLDSSGSTGVDCDTCTEVSHAATLRVQRSRSCSDLGERPSLERTLSF